jgi:hypothetical protein
MIVQMQSLFEFSYGASTSEIEGDDGDVDWEMVNDEDSSDDDFSDWEMEDEDSDDDQDDNDIVVVYDSSDDDSDDDDNLPSNSELAKTLFERVDPNQQQRVLCNQVYAQNSTTGYGNPMKHLGSPIRRNTFLPEGVFGVGVEINKSTRSSGCTFPSRCPDTCHCRPRRRPRCCCTPRSLDPPVLPPKRPFSVLTSVGRVTTVHCTRTVPITTLGIRRNSY